MCGSSVRLATTACVARKHSPRMRSVDYDSSFIMAAGRRRHYLHRLSALAKWAGACLISLLVVLSAVFAGAESRLEEFASKTTAQEFFPEATRYGQQRGAPPILPVYAADRLLGYVYLNTDFTTAIG